MNMDPTPTKNTLPLRKGDFTNLAEALDYAAAGNTGYNFYDGAGKLSAVLPYKTFRKGARSLARRLLGLGPSRGARVALVADTHPDSKGDTDQRGGRRHDRRGENLSELRPTIAWL